MCLAGETYGHIEYRCCEIDFRIFIHFSWVMYADCDWDLVQDRELLWSWIIHNKKIKLLSASRSLFINSFLLLDMCITLACVQKYLSAVSNQVNIAFAYAHKAQTTRRWERIRSHMGIGQSFGKKYFRWCRW